MKLFLILFTCALYAAPPVRPVKTIRLFNGKDLTNFYTWSKISKYEDPRRVFTVHDGQIHISGEDYGAITTKETYRDYRLLVEWKWGERAFPPRVGKARDSGVLVHAVGEDGAYGGIWMQSFEAQIIEGGTGDFLVVPAATHLTLTVESRVAPNGEYYWEKGQAPATKDRGRFNWFGRDPNWKDVWGFRGAKDVDRPAGKWNRLEVICDGDSITNVVNGTIVNHGTRASQTEGKIQIQSEGAEIFVRKVELHPLKKK